MTTTTAPTAPARTGRWPLAAACAVTVAGGLHLIAALDHLHHDVLFVGFFLAVGAVQAAGGPGLRRATRPGPLIAWIAGTVALVLLYGYSRTVGLQFGPHADRPEAADPVGMVVVACELVAVAGLLAMLPPRWRSRTVDGLLALGAGLWLLWSTGALL